MLLAPQRSAKQEEAEDKGIQCSSKAAETQYHCATSVYALASQVQRHLSNCVNSRVTLHQMQPLAVLWAFMHRTLRAVACQDYPLSEPLAS